MKVYHGSTMEIITPDILHSNRYVDFGKGFYATSFQDQAARWALRKAMRTRKEAVVNIYEFDDLSMDVVVKNFSGEDEKWLDFVCDCRRGVDIGTEDIIIGPVADDDVFKTVDMYFRGLWDKDRALKELRYYHKSDQIVFKSAAAIIKTLKFCGSYKVD